MTEESIAMLKTAAGRGLPWLLLLAIGLGCSPEPVAKQSGSSAAPASRIATDAGKAPAPAAARLSSKQPSAAAVSPPRAAPASSHPIDSAAEGQIYRRAVAALDQGDFQRAEQLRSQLDGHPVFTVLAEAISAIKLVKQGQHEEALHAAEQISRVPVMQAEAYVIAGEVFQAQGRWSEAIAAFTNALQTHAEHLRAHRWLGAIYYDSGAMGLAVDHLRKASELDPADYRALRLAGLIHYDYQKYDEAVLDYRQVLQRPMPQPLEVEVRLELADSLRELRQIDEALAVLEPCEPSASVLAMRAVCYEAAGDDSQALETAQQALAQEPRHRRANLVAGRIFLAQRDWEVAIAHFQTVVDDDPTAHEPRFLLGRALLQAGHQQRGQAELERSTELKEMTLQLAEWHLDAMERPEDVELRFRMGELAEKIGRQRTALGWYQAAQGLDPQHRQAAKAAQRLQTSLSADARQESP